jgi:hypothetical protein
MTAEQKAEYDARQAVKVAADKRRREELMLRELAKKKKPGWPITRPMVQLPEQFRGGDEGAAGLPTSPTA